MTLLPQRLHALDRLGERYVAAPMQEVDVDAIRLQALQAALCGVGEPGPGAVPWIGLGDQEYLLAPALDRLADDFLGLAFAIHLRGVDQRHAEIEAKPDRLHRLAALPPLQFPSALTKRRDAI